MHDQRRNDRRHLFPIERDLAVLEMEARYAMKDRRPFLRRQIARVLARLPALLLRRMHERLADPLVSKEIAKVLPRLVELILVVAAGVFPVPHP
jgi:hypothetical protein